ncbi:hypothetical protein [Vibrio sinaloensis]|uniref:hypothetical protein n=1 Tax=Photobacterium sp. (strain ATCC 43367) TaxID=379097 RepID=UPI0035E72877
MKLLVVFIISISFSHYLAAKSFPSAGAAIVLPGQHQQSIDLDGALLSPQDVIDWELANSDLVFGSYPNREDNERTSAIGYMYNQKLEMNSGQLESDIRDRAEQQGIDYEDLFLHFAEDTILAEVEPTHGDKTIINREPMIVGYTANEMHAGFWLYQASPWDADVFENSDRGGALYVYHSEQFDRLKLSFSQFAQGGTFRIEYPAMIDTSGFVTEWKTLAIKKDRTLNMTKNQSIVWHMPRDWKRATTHDGSGASYGGGQYFGSRLLRDGGRLFAVRIIWQPKENETMELRPRLKEVKLKNSFPEVKLTGADTTTSEGLTIQKWRKVRGFDKQADLNNDNYLSWQEYKSRSNKNATARFRWESRVIPFGRMWNQSSSWALTNLASPQLLTLMQDYYHQTWSEQGLKGAYNDDTNKLIGANQFHVHSGGKVLELGAVVGSTDANRLYQQHFADFLTELASSNSDALISVNIGTANMLGRNGQTSLLGSASLYLREHYLVPSMGLSGYVGLAKFWDNAVLAQGGHKVIYQATTRYGRVEYLGNDEQNWKQDQYSTLAVYYLNHHSDRSYFSQWNSGYIYGSENTTSDNFWQSGVAKNIAYQPSRLLNIDIGEPKNSIPAGYDAIPLMLSTSTPYPADYTLVGDSSSLSVMHPDLPNGTVNVRPTYTYFLVQSEREIVPQGPETMVLARDFTKGKVLYRTDFFGKSSDFYHSEKVTIPLDPAMRPVDENGNIGEYVDQVQIGGYQGVILLY